jgi:glycosyltransferase involved in cell wall biosynthesis
MVTVFTPIYNRAYIMEELYNSLLRQTSYNLEWLIVDDGSTDNIAELVNQWQCNSNPFPIHFIQQKNGGKHRAVNRGVREAKGEAFFIVDSDDYLVDNAIQLIENWWKDIAGDNSFAGVAGLRAKKSMCVIGDEVAFDGYVDATNLERAQYGLKGDKAEVYKTEILKKYPFPEFDGENFITEAVVWDKIAYEGYKIRWYNRITYICEYREDGLTHSGAELFYRNPKGWGLYISQNRQFGKSDDTQDYFAKLNYFGMLHIKLADEEIMSNLEITEEELEHIKKYIRNTIEFIGKNIAIYGLGKRGQRLIKLYQGTPITIKYVLDKNEINSDFMQPSFDDELPNVDAVIVTPKAEQNEIMNWLNKKTKNKLLRYEEWKDIVI